MSFHENHEEKIKEQYFKLRPLVQEMIKNGGVDFAFKEFHLITDRAFEPVNKLTSCKKGCANCCYDSILLSYVEAEYIYFKLKDCYHTLDIDEKLMQKQIDCNNDYSKLKWAEKRCIFLDKDNSCQIYEHRPIICRSHNSTEEPYKCKIGDNGKSPEHGQLWSSEVEALQGILAEFNNFGYTTLLSVCQEIKNTNNKICP